MSEGCQFFFVWFHISFTLSANLERPEHHNNDWIATQRSEPSTLIDLTFALKQQNVNELQELLLKVSTPSHDLYGKHLSIQQVQEITMPVHETANTVRKWLISNGINPIEIQNATSNGDFIRIRSVQYQFLVVPYPQNLI